MGKKILQLFWLQALIAVCGTVFAHPDLDLQIEETSRQISQNPDDAELFLKRGELYRRHSDIERALEDINQARMLDPGHLLLDWYEGRLALDAGDYHRANKLFSLYIDSHPAHASVFYLRGMARDGIGQFLFAAEDYSRAIQLSKTPGPSLFRSQTLSLLAANEWEAAEVSIKKGLSHFPREVSLLGIAVEISLIKSDSRQALTYLTRLPQKVQELPQWRFRKGIWHCVAGDDSAASSTFASLLTDTEAGAIHRSGTWDVPAAAIATLVNRPQADACVALVKELLIKQTPGLTEYPNGG